MPYIRPELREDIDKSLLGLIKLLDWTEKDNIDGVMNYVITKLIRSQYNRGSYEEYNAAIGVLECAKLEFYRRAIAPYEDIKIKENGDV